MTNWIKKFIEKLAEANKDNLPQGEKLDCCNINKDNHYSTKKN